MIRDGIFVKQAFVDIRRYILKYGDLETYCNRFNRNPHLKIDDFNVYLNPVDQLGERINSICIESEFTTIVIRNEGSQYFHIELNASSEALDLQEPWSNKKLVDLEKEIKPYFEKILSYIKVKK